MEEERKKNRHLIAPRISTAMFCKIFCNSLIVICIMVTTVYGIEVSSSEFESLKKQVAELMEEVKRLNEKADSTESFKKDMGEQLQKLTESTAELEKGAYLAENQIMKIQNDVAQFQSETQVPTQELKVANDKLEKIENKTAELNKQLVEKENLLMKVTTDQDQMKNEFNLAVENVKKEINSDVELFMKDTSREVEKINGEITWLNNSTAETEKQLKKLTAYLEDMKSGNVSNLPVFVNVSKQNVINEPSCMFSAQAEKRLKDLTDDIEMMKRTQVSNLPVFVNVSKENVKTKTSSTSSSQAGSSYVRWGSSSCPSDAELIYNGFVGGSNWHYSGSAVDYLCFTTNPDKSQPSEYEPGAHIHGGEYRIRNAPQTNMDPVCAVCRIPRSTAVMIPAKSSCSPGWTREYTGYLMAGKWSHEAATAFICVDESLSSVPASGGDEKGKLLYYSYMLCGHKSCEKYDKKNRVVCTVCSK